MNEEAITKELNNILDFWSTRAFNKQTGLFFGRIDNDGNVYPQAALGAVMYSRIIWSFSAGYLYTKKTIYKKRALQAYRILKSFFYDQENGGLYWSVLPTGRPLERRKQIYAQAFGIYALAELYKIEPSKGLLEEISSLFNLIEKYSYDEETGGYIDAFNEDWKPIDDMRLSEKDMNAPKTMNTHLHILEAYSNFYSIQKDKLVKERIIQLLTIFRTKIIHPQKKHLQLFFTKNWKSLSINQSFGHDIEASWLMIEAAENVYGKDVPKSLIDECNALALISADGLLTDGSLAYEKTGRFVNKERHWWVQAEAWVGFYATGIRREEAIYFQYAENLWNYIQNEIKDEVNGEWFWGKDENGNILKEDKVGIWKCPYHTSRACLEVLKKLKIEVQSKD